MDLVLHNQNDALRKIFSTANNTILVVVPFIKESAINNIIDMIHSNVELTVLTNWSYNSLKTNSTDITALKIFKENFQNIKVYLNTTLHAKVYIADNKLAFITSANLTVSGLANNVECGVLINDKDNIEALIDYFKSAISQSTELSEFIFSTLEKKHESQSYYKSDKDIENDINTTIKAKFSRVCVDKYDSLKNVPTRLPSHFFPLALGDTVYLSNHTTSDGKLIPYLVNKYEACIWDNNCLKRIIVHQDGHYVEKNLEKQDRVRDSFKSNGEWVNPYIYFKGYSNSAESGLYARFSYKSGAGFSCYLDKKQIPPTMIELVPTLNVTDRGKLDISDIELVELIVDKMNKKRFHVKK